MAKRTTSYHYLFRFIVTLTLALLIPVLLFFLVVVDSSYQQLRQTTDKFYADITDSFYVYFENELSSMQTQALELSVKSGARESGTFSVEQLQENPYHYQKVIDYVSRMTSPYKRYELFLYYGDLQHVYSAQYKYDLDRFLDMESGRDENARALLQAFFEDGGAEQRLCSTFEMLDLKNAALYVGTPISMGISGTPGMLVFKLRYSTINASMFSTQNAAMLDLCVLDSEGGLLFTNGYNTRRFLPTDAFQAVFAHPSGMATLTLEDEPYTLFRAKTPMGHVREYVAAIPRDAIEKEIQGFYDVTRQGTLLILALLLVALLCVVVYVNYIPIRRLVKRVEPSGKSELHAIESAIDRMETELVEKDVLVMSFLISNLLYGVPIPAEEAARHGLGGHKGGACVMTLAGEPLDNLTREKLSQEMAARFGTRAFITDMLYEDYTVVICLMQDTETDALRDCMQNFLGADGNHIFVGDVVESLNEIQSSYKSCLRQMKRGTARKPAEKTSEIQSKLKEDIMRYMDQNFTNPQLNQPIVSDHFGLSVYSLSRFFKEHMGIGFSEYITGKRIAHAKHLLVTTDMSVASIAQAVGIENTNYFSRLFKSNCGLTPQAYRSRMESDG